MSFKELYIYLYLQSVRRLCPTFQRSRKKTTTDRFSYSHICPVLLPSLSSQHFSVDCQITNHTTIAVLFKYLLSFASTYAVHGLFETQKQKERLISTAQPSPGRHFHTEHLHLMLLTALWKPSLLKWPRETVIYEWNRKQSMQQCCGSKHLVRSRWISWKGWVICFKALP